MSYCIGIIGGGNMAEAMVSGLISDGYDAARIMVGDINEERLAYLRKNYQVKVTIDNRQIVSSSDVVILALKPSVLEAVLRPLQEMFSKQLVISIAAGITIGKLTECIVGKLPIVRVMPNTPCLIREGISAIAYNDLVSSEQVTIAKDIFSSVGQVIVTEEKFLNAITGLSGSGPAYVYLIIEALADAGVQVGLDRNSSLLLATQTVIGAGKMVIETGRHPAQLKDAVTSPGGTTIAALHVLEQGKLRGTLMEAVKVATKRAEELNGE